MRVILVTRRCLLSGPLLEPARPNRERGSPSREFLRILVVRTRPRRLLVQIQIFVPRGERKRGPTPRTREIVRSDARDLRLLACLLYFPRNRKRGRPLPNLPEIRRIGPRARRAALGPQISVPPRESKRWPQITHAHVVGANSWRLRPRPARFQPLSDRERRSPRIDELLGGLRRVRARARHPRRGFF